MPFIFWNVNCEKMKNFTSFISLYFSHIWLYLGVMVNVSLGDLVMIQQVEVNYVNVTIWYISIDGEIVNQFVLVSRWIFLSNTDGLYIW